MNFWNHQVAAIESSILAIEAGWKSGLIVLPTGAGKTAVALSLGHRLGWRMLFLVHRDRLIGQTKEAARKFWPEASVGVVRRERDEWDGSMFDEVPRLVIGSVQSLHKKRLLAMPRNRFDLIVVDEAHHAPSPSWSSILEWFLAKFLLGVTATPQRLDKRGLAGWFGREPIYTYSIFQAITDGVLCKVESCEIQTQVDLDAVTVRHGDFSPEQLAKAVNTPSRNAQVVEAYQEYSQGRRAIAFCVDIVHCDSLAQRFANAGIQSAAVHSMQSSDENDRILDAFSRGELDVVTSCEALTEGFDDPGVSCILMCRPTESRAFYVQMVGRGLRQFHGKHNCLVIDFTDNCEKHKLACSLDLFGGRRRSGTSPGIRDFESDDAIPTAPIDVPVVSWRLKESCPWPSMPTLDDYVSVNEWDDDDASKSQLAYLQAFGVRVRDDLTKGEASHLISRCKEFDAVFPKPATTAQRRLLERAGLWTDGLGRRQASSLIGNLQKSRI